MMAEKQIVRIVVDGFIEDWRREGPNDWRSVSTGGTASDLWINERIRQSQAHVLTDGSPVWQPAPQAAHDHYLGAMTDAFPWVLRGEPDELRDVARELLESQPDCPAGGSSFALVVRPEWRLYLSDASADRVMPHSFRNAKLCRSTTLR